MDAPRPTAVLVRHQSGYTDLAREIRESGLLNRRYTWYWSRIAIAVVAFVAVWVGLFWLGNSWFQLIIAAFLGVLSTQFGFLGHDAAHRQVFRSATWNDWTARVLAGVFAGLSYGWWRDKHNKHHNAPNQEGKDPDVAAGAIAFTASAAAKRRGFTRWVLLRQGWLFFPLLTLEGLNLHIASVRTLLTRGSVPHQRLEAGLVVVRLVAFVAVLLWVLPFGKASAFLGLELAVFGLCLGASFAPNHKGMPIVPPQGRPDFLSRQVLMSRNVRGGPLVDAAMGGLNYQIEHHLFPSMPRPNLRRAQPIIRAYCDRAGVSYAEVGLVESWGIVVRHLNAVGLRAEDTFSCPMAQQLRA